MSVREGVVIPGFSRRIYENNPIAEATCEFRFSSPSDGWLFFPYRLQEKLTDLFPSEATTDSQAFPPAVNGVPGMSGSPVQVLVGMGNPNRIKIASEDGKSMLIAAPHSLAISVLEPYSGWEYFSEAIKRLLAAFAELTNGDFSVERVGLRYINRVNAPVDNVSEFFSLKPLSFDGLDVTPNTFVSRSELKFSEIGGRVLIATFAKGLEVSFGESVILDLDVVAQSLSDVKTPEKAFDVVLELRDVEKRAFEAAITERTRLELFGGYTEEDD